MGGPGSTRFPDSLSILGLETMLASFTIHEHAWVQFPHIQWSAGCCYQSSTEKSQAGREHTCLRLFLKSWEFSSPQLTRILTICCISTHNYFQKNGKIKRVSSQSCCSTPSHCIYSLPLGFITLEPCDAKTPTSPRKDEEKSQAWARGATLPSQMIKSNLLN